MNQSGRMLQPPIRIYDLNQRGERIVLETAKEKKEYLGGDVIRMDGPVSMPPYCKTLYYEVSVKHVSMVRDCQECYVSCINVKAK